MARAGYPTVGMDQSGMRAAGCQDRQYPAKACRRPRPGFQRKQAVSRALIVLAMDPLGHIDEERIDLLSYRPEGFGARDDREGAAAARHPGPVPR